MQTYQAGANTYIPKPDEYPSYRELVATLARLLGRHGPESAAPLDALARQAAGTGLSQSRIWPLRYRRPVAIAPLASAAADCPERASMPCTRWKTGRSPLRLELRHGVRLPEN